MPIKIPKPFARRKSSANALEEVQNAPAPSFKVFERSPGGNRSWDGTNGLVQPNQVHAYETTENDYDGDLFPINKDESGNRGSGGTNMSASTAPYGSAASSARFSSSSTIPSTTDISNDSHTNSMVSGQRPYQDIPVPPVPRSRGWSIKNAGRTFSFASKQKNELPPLPSPSPDPLPTVSQDSAFTPSRRERAMTASTASTATPPRLLDGDLSFGDSNRDSFGNMFDSVGVSSNRASPKVDLPPLPDESTDSPRQRLSPLPPTLDLERTRAAASSPYSFASRNSTDGLMGSPNPGQLEGHVDASPPAQRRALPSSQSMPLPRAPSSPPRVAGSYTRGQKGPPLAKSPSSMEDEDARLLANSVRRDSYFQPSTQTQPRRTLEPTKATGAQDESSDNDELLFSATSPSRPNISRTAPKLSSPPSSFRQPNVAGVDSSLADSIRLAAQFEASAPAQEKPGKKVMTPAQFERYRQQQEMSRTRSDSSEKDNYDGENDSYEDEDEVEHDRQAAKQRKKQEAHLAVYRQTMMKVTGESTIGLSNNASQAGRFASMSTPELSRMSHLTVGTGVSSHSGKSSGTDEEDEDVPLGILAAHGFPNKNKPPSQLHRSSSNSNLRGSTPLPAPPVSVSGESRGGSRGNLPVFARNLPQDPYYGASLVNPPSREQFSMGGGQSFGGVASGQVHPSGLVGVIAGEERARAMRRGSPNPQTNPETFSPAQHPGMMGRSQTMGNMSTVNGLTGVGVAGMMPPQALSAGDQAQIQMAQQMTQMMQMQMQWMQQMTQMQQGGQLGQMPQQPQPGTLPMPNFGGMLGDMGGPGQRPFSMPLPEPPRPNDRTMSLTPGMTNQWNRNSSYAPSMVGGLGGYAPSIAPSERSNIGMASRYRPVSMVGDSIKPVNNRSSTLTSSTIQPWMQGNEQGRLSPSNTNTTIRPSSGLGLGQKPRTRDDEDDDDQGWADMKKKRDKKKGLWKMKKYEKGIA